MIAEVYQKEKEQENSMLISLVERIQTGDQQAFLDFYEMTKKAVVFNVRQNGVPERDLEDIVQDIYVKVFKNIASLKDPSSAFGWVRKIAVNTARNYHRKAETKHEELLYEKTGDDGDQLDPFDSFDVNDSMSAVLPMPAEIIDAREGSRMIYDMIMELPEKQGLSMMDYFYNDMSVSEIALSMEVPENTVKSWLRRGKKAMQIKLETLAKEKGIKLYTAVLLPVIAAAFKKQAEAGEVPFSLDKMVRELIALVVAAGAAGGAASGLAGANLAGGLPEKIADNVVHGIEKSHVNGTGIIREPVDTGTPLSEPVSTAGAGTAEPGSVVHSTNLAGDAATGGKTAVSAGFKSAGTAGKAAAGKAAAAALSKGALVKTAAVLSIAAIGGGAVLISSYYGSGRQDSSAASTVENTETAYADSTEEPVYAYEQADDIAQTGDSAENSEHKDTEDTNLVVAERKGGNESQKITYDEKDLMEMQGPVYAAAFTDCEMYYNQDLKRNFSAKDSDVFWSCMWSYARFFGYLNGGRSELTDSGWVTSEDVLNYVAYAIFPDYNGEMPNFPYYPDGTPTHIIKNDDNYYFHSSDGLGEGNYGKHDFQVLDDGSVLYHVILEEWDDTVIWAKTYRVVPNENLPAGLNSPFKFRIDFEYNGTPTIEDEDSILSEYEDIFTLYHDIHFGYMEKDAAGNPTYMYIDIEPPYYPEWEKRGILAESDIEDKVEAHLSGKYYLYSFADIDDDGNYELLIGGPPVSEDEDIESTGAYTYSAIKAIYTHEGEQTRAVLLSDSQEVYVYGSDGYIYRAEDDGSFLKMELRDGALRELNTVTKVPQTVNISWRMIRYDD